MFRRIEEKKATLTSDKLPSLLVYKAPVRQVFQNLISNALKYTTKNMPVEIHISVSELKSYWQFSITDNGIGIEEEHLHRIFDMFFRATMQSEGAGLGLYILKETIEKIEGKINVSSKIGEGVSFMINLPNLPVPGN